ncbi:MAG: transposase, partial [Flavobacteriaceae bacterium]|nr:transposase [Flavobacteriaceae bacterium]
MESYGAGLKNHGQVCKVMYGTLSPDQSSPCLPGDQISLDQSIGDLFRAYGEEYIRIYHPSSHKIKLIRAIRVCKTPYLGGQTIKCKDCGKELKVYHSCGHSQCPLCQSIKRAQWQEKLGDKLLAVPYVHTVFTLPHELNKLGRRYPSELYNLLMRCAWRTVKRLSSDPDNIGGLPGMVSVLHTFGSDLKYHLHVHCLITFGGLNNSGAWVWPRRKKQLASYREMCREFRKEFLSGMEKLISKRKIKVGLDWAAVKSIIEKKRWNVKNTYPTMETSLIENYLSRYINRVAISRNRFKYIADQQKVEILYHDYRNQEEGKAAPKKLKPLAPLLAIHQIMMHVLPPYFQKARYYGLHSVATFKRLQDKIPDKLKRNG